MTKILYRIWLSINSSFWLITIYGLQKNWSFWIFTKIAIDIVLVLLPIVSSALSLLLLKHFSTQESAEINISEIELADNEFLPTYLGYFFVSLGLNELYTLGWIYGLILLFVFISSMQYFNPIFLLFGYHFYHMTTVQGTKIFVIVKGKVIRKVSDIDLSGLRRLNNTCYIGWRL